MLLWNRVFASRKRAVMPCGTTDYGIFALSELGEIEQSCNKHRGYCVFEGYRQNMKHLKAP